MEISDALPEVFICIYANMFMHKVGKFPSAIFLEVKDKPLLDLGYIIILVLIVYRQELIK